MLLNRSFLFRHFGPSESAEQKVLVVFMSRQNLFVLSDIELCLSSLFVGFGVEVGQKIGFGGEEFVSSQDTFDFSVFESGELVFVLFEEFVEFVDFLSLFAVGLFYHKMLV